MFKAVSPKLDIIEVEKKVRRFWKRGQIFKQSGDLRKGGPEYVFYEGPPTANGKPGVHHALARAFKDIFPRYKSMRGHHVIRRGGWDTHGLPVEIAVERAMGFTSKSQIEAYGIGKFNQLCRKSAFDYIQDWEDFTDRLGFWVDLENAYVTFTNEYIESVWWILKSFWERGLLYAGYKVVPYCPRCGTPLSDHEVALGYREVDDPSIFVRLPLVDDPSTSLLVWTTTPWTLPGNVAVAVHPEVDYVTVERSLPDGETEQMILAEKLVSSVFDQEEVRFISKYKGKKLKDKRYKPLFTFVVPDKPAYRVILEDFVTTSDGSGLVHIAPAFGAEDLDSSKKHDLSVIMTVSEEGTFNPEVRPWSGMFVKDADPLITQDLDARGLLLKSGTYTHTYPFCWRCETPLLYYARGTWYIRTSQFKDKMVEYNQRINWVPNHIKDGRFGNWLENNVDWALGRERYWGTPLPIWICSECDHQLAVGSVSELSSLSGRDLSDLDLHRPYVDNVLIPCPECKGSMRRIPELIDAWFDSGSMPVAQWHYPFENQKIYEEQFPADFICEAVDQTRGWFYSLHAISTILSDSESFKNVICLGLILDAEGKKMSTSRGNIVDPWDVLNRHGADALRWYLYTASPPGQERNFSVDLVGEVVRNFTLTLWNVYSFFVTYANLDGWSPEDYIKFPEPQNELDAWLRSELHTLVRDVTNALEKYDVTRATRPIENFVDALSNWYLRRSRRRFWKSESDDDKLSAYSTLYETLVTLSRLLAPTMPFMAEELYQNLVVSIFPDAPESIHLTDWQLADLQAVDESLNRKMKLVMKLASLGHSARNKAGIKVRQPLSEIAFSISSQDDEETLQEYAHLLADELNVKNVRILGSAGEAVSYQLKPLPKQLGQKYKSLFPKIKHAVEELNAEKSAGILLSGKTLEVEVEGITYELFPEEIEVRTEAKTGLVVSSEGAYLSALQTELTPELIKEGLAREFVRKIQDLRKQSGFDISDRIVIYLESSPLLALAVHDFQDYIKGETLALEILDAIPPELETKMEFIINDETATTALVKKDTS